MEVEATPRHVSQKISTHVNGGQADGADLGARTPIGMSTTWIMMIQLMSLLTSQNKQEKEMRLSVCYLICSFGSAQTNSSP
jgi:hypothetical protein